MRSRIELLKNELRKDTILIMSLRSKVPQLEAPSAAREGLKATEGSDKGETYRSSAPGGKVYFG